MKNSWKVKGYISKYYTDSFLKRHTLYTESEFIFSRFPQLVAMNALNLDSQERVWVFGPITLLDY